MKRIKVLELQKTRGKFVIITNKIAEYKGVCGVWIMYDNHEQLLEVAQTADVFKELANDLSWLLKEYSCDGDLRKRYTARRLFEFNQKFDVLSCDKNRTTAKYRTIAETVETIVVYLVVEDRATSRDKTVREKVELEIAIDNKALYWNAFGIQRKLAKDYYKKKYELK